MIEQYLAGPCRRGVTAMVVVSRRLKKKLSLNIWLEANGRNKWIFFIFQDERGVQFF